MTKGEELRADWAQFRRLQRGSARRFLNTLTGSADADPIPFVIWAAALGLTPPLLTAIRTAVRLGMIGNADATAVLGLVRVLRVLYILYAMLMMLLVTAAIWEALLPNRDDQEIVGTLPVRPTILATARLAAGCRVMLALSLCLAVPVAVIFGSASASQALIGSLPRVLAAHVVTIVCASSSVFFTLVTLRAAVATWAGEQLADHFASLLQFLTVLVFVEAFIFFPGLMANLVRALRETGPPPLWYAPPLWFGALYGWIAEGGPRTSEVDAALLLTFVPTAAAIGLTLIPAKHVARRVQQSLPGHRASRLTSILRAMLSVRRPTTAVSGMALFATATLTRSRRHAAIVASFAGLAFAMAAVELLTSGFTHHFSIAAPRRDNLAVPLVFLFFAVYGLRTALSRPADPGANWPFRISPPPVRAARGAARLVIVICGAGPVIVITALTAFVVWPTAVAARVIALDIAAAVLLIELSLARWTRLPCASLDVAATDSVRSKWPLQVLVLYLFAFRGADLEMLALRRAGGVPVALCVIAMVVGGIRATERRRRPSAVTVDVVDDGPLLLQLSGREA